MELACRSREDRELKLDGSEIESLRFLLYRVLEEPGTAPDKIGRASCRERV